MGPVVNDAKRARVLNRVVRWGDNCIEHEVDHRRAERPTAERNMGGSNVMTTPGVGAPFTGSGNDQPLSLRLHSPSRGAVARANHVDADELDAMLSCN